MSRTRVVMPISVIRMMAFSCTDSSMVMVFAFDVENGSHFEEVGRTVLMKVSMLMVAWGWPVINSPKSYQN